MEADRFCDAFSYGRYKVDRVLDDELATLKPGSRVLDVGCGTGVYLRRFASKGFTPFGLEPAPAMLAAARRDNPGVDIREGIATALPFEDASVDAVTAIEVHRYLHLEDIRASLREMVRVLRPGGFLFTTLVNTFSLDGFYLRQRSRQWQKGVEFDRRNPHCEFFTPSQAEAELVRAGATDARTIGRMFAPMRLFYRWAPNLGKDVARTIEASDDGLHRRVKVFKPFAGHLIAIGRRPA